MTGIKVKRGERNRWGGGGGEGEVSLRSRAIVLACLVRYYLSVIDIDSLGESQVTFCSYKVSKQNAISFLDDTA